MQNVSIYQSISSALTYPMRYPLSVGMSVCCQNLKGYWDAFFIIEIAWGNPKPKYNKQKFKHKRQKQKAES